MTEPIEDRLRHIARHPRRCEEPACALPTRRIGSRCAKHADALTKNGHPTAPEVTANELRPWRRRCRTFVDDQMRRGHPGVRAACEWLAERLQGAQEPPQMHAKTAPAVRWEAGLAKLRRDGVDPQDILAVAIACHLHRALHARAWPDERFFRQQLGKHVLALAGRRRVKSGRFAQDGARCNTAPMRRPASVCLLAAEELTRALGVLLIRAAEHLAAELTRPQAATGVPGMHAPFIQ